MNTKTIAAVLAGLTGTTLSISCDKSPAPSTEVPGAAASTNTKDAAEHACGNHPEGACGAEISPDAVAEVPDSRSFVVEPGKFAEANFQMTEGSTFTATFREGSTDMAWDIHSHDHSGGTKIHDKGTGGEGSVEFTAPADGVFSVLWKNVGSASTPLEVSITLHNGASIHSWIPTE